MCSFARAIAQALIDWASKAADDASTAKTMPPTVVSTAVQCRADLSTVVAQSATLAAPFVHVTAPALDDKSLIEHVLRTFADATGDVARYKHADHGRAARKQRKVPGTGRTPSPSALVVDTDGSSVRSGEGGSCASDTPRRCVFHLYSKTPRYPRYYSLIMSLLCVYYRSCPRGLDVTPMPLASPILTPSVDLCHISCPSRPCLSLSSP